MQNTHVPKTNNQYIVSDEPGKPGRPDITDWDSDRIDLKWEPPTKDGGAPITSYVVEKKDPFTKVYRNKQG